MTNEWFDVVYLGFLKAFLVWKTEHMEDESFRELTPTEQRLIEDFNFKQEEERKAFLRTFA